MTSQGLKRPTPNLVSLYVTRFEQSDEYSIPDKALSKLFEMFPRDHNLEDVLLKVATLNSLYNTNIYATYEVAKHICRLNIDPKLEQRSSELVNEISTITIRGKTRRNYSFASKYCSWHLPDDYPIYDSFVERLIWRYQSSDRFADFKRSELQNYPLYKEIIDCFRRYYNLTQFSFKVLDKFLWLYGKEVFPSASL